MLQSVLWSISIYLKTNNKKIPLRQLFFTQDFVIRQIYPSCNKYHKNNSLTLLLQFFYFPKWININLIHDFQSCIYTNHTSSTNTIYLSIWRNITFNQKHDMTCIIFQRFIYWAFWWSKFIVYGISSVIYIIVIVQRFW